MAEENPQPIDNTIPTTDFHMVLEHKYDTSSPLIDLEKMLRDIFKGGDEEFDELLRDAMRKIGTTDKNKGLLYKMQIVRSIKYLEGLNRYSATTKRHLIGAYSGFMIEFLNEMICPPTEPLTKETANELKDYTFEFWFSSLYEAGFVIMLSYVPDALVVMKKDLPPPFPGCVDIKEINEIEDDAGGTGADAGAGAGADACASGAGACASGAGAPAPIKKNKKNKKRKRGKKNRNKRRNKK